MTPIGQETPPERVLVCLSEKPAAQQVIRRAARLAIERNAELYALYVEMPGASTRRPPEVSAGLEHNLRLARDLGAQVEVLSSHRVGEAILRFAHEHAIGTIVLGCSHCEGWRRLLGGDVVERIRKGCGAIEIQEIPA
jgi:two-component system, OmpR family, sensor histidine kinase KdpD